MGGQTVLDSINVKLVWEKYYPNFWVPEKDFTSAAKLEKTKPVEGLEGVASHGKLSAGSTSTDDVLLIDSSAKSDLAGLVKIAFGSVDQWYEELTPVIYHPKNPLHRIDILPSSRHIKVEIDGVKLADTGSDGGVMSLWETGLPGRWYLPPTAVDFSKLSESSTHTGCPYKGEASYYNVTVNGKEYKDAVWYYRYPITESAPIQGMVSTPQRLVSWTCTDPNDARSSASTLARLTRGSMA